MKAITNLRKTREMRGETVTSMAHKLNIGVSRYYMIEIGERPASAEIAEKVSSILKVNQNKIFLPQSFTTRDIKDTGTDG